METIGGKGIDKIYDVVSTPDGFLLVGSTTSFGVDKEDVYIVKVDNTGKMVWNRKWGDWESDRGYAITRTRDNNTSWRGMKIITGIQPSAVEEENNSPDE